MDIADAQREMRVHYAGAFYGQLVSGVLWLASAALGTWATPRLAIATLVIGGMFIFPMTTLLLRLTASRPPLSADNSLSNLGMQIALVLPISMLLLYPVTLFRLTLFYPAMMILLGAHYLPFVFLYGMRMFWALGSLLVAGGIVAARYPSIAHFTMGAWFTTAMLLIFAFIGRLSVAAE
jgi:hypothetical protein